jgi:hypothetical protein
MTHPAGFAEHNLPATCDDDAPRRSGTRGLGSRGEFWATNPAADADRLAGGAPPECRIPNPESSSSPRAQNISPIDIRATRFGFGAHPLAVEILPSKFARSEKVTFSQAAFGSPKSRVTIMGTAVYSVRFVLEAARRKCQNGRPNVRPGPVSNARMTSHESPLGGPGHRPCRRQRARTHDVDDDLDGGMYWSGEFCAAGGGRLPRRERDIRKVMPNGVPTRCGSWHNRDLVAILTNSVDRRTC